ncbi:Uncharacterized protein Rs2_44251 [Raphanus sativus]|nr:Uncharacterized protein Rs2_44251 [Raphanus sativus]
MFSSPSEKKNSDVEMGEANSAFPTPAMHEATPTFLAGFLSFKERLSRCSAEKEATRNHDESSAVPSSSAMSSLAEGKKSTDHAAPFVGADTALATVPEVSVQPSGSSTTPAPVPKEEKGLPAASTPPLPKSRKRGSAATEVAKKRRCTKGAEGEPLGFLMHHRTKFVSLIDGMLDDCGSVIERLTKDLAESREVKKRSEDALKSIEDAHTGDVSRLEAQVSDLERDLGKLPSAFSKLKKEKKKRVYEVHRLQREIQKREESEDVVSSDDFRARLTRMAALFGSLLSVHERDLALANVEGSLSEIRLLKGERAPTLDSMGTEIHTVEFC